MLCLETPLYHLLQLHPQSEVGAQRWCMHRLRNAERINVSDQGLYVPQYTWTGWWVIQRRSRGGYCFSNFKLTALWPGSLSNSLDTLTWSAVGVLTLRECVVVMVGFSPVPLNISFSKTQHNTILASEVLVTEELSGLVNRVTVQQELALARSLYTNEWWASSLDTVKYLTRQLRSGPRNKWTTGTLGKEHFCAKAAKHHTHRSWGYMAQSTKFLSNSSLDNVSQHVFSGSLFPVSFLSWLMCRVLPVKCYMNHERATVSRAMHKTQ